MLFNSIDFAIFLPIVFLIYWLLAGQNRKSQNMFILVASYFFYGWWDWRFLSLILFSTLLDYFVGITLSATDNKTKRRILLSISLILNLSILFIFKYYNFFIENFVAAFSLFGVEIPLRNLDLIFPIGISFYTFQTMSYTIDVYKQKYAPTRDLIAFAAFVAFFPQLVAGPIERATNLLPQFFARRNFEYLKATDGLRQILWGLLKKVVIADNCADYVDMVFGDPSGYNASTLAFAAMLFPVQVYCDFSGYSDIAIGTARLFGIHLNRNFAFPFFATSVSELWRRWHISLYTWFRDYVFLPYIFSKKNRSKWVIAKASFLIFVLIGLWHGANWTFILWGILNAFYVALPIIMERKRKINEFPGEEVIFPGFYQIYRMIQTYLLISVSAILFRAESLFATKFYISQLFSDTILTLPEKVPVSLIYLLIAFQIVEWFGRNHEFAIQKTGMSWPTPIRWSFYIVIFFIIGMFMKTGENPFVYFAF